MFILAFFSLLTCGEFLQDVCPGRELVTNGKFIVSTYLYSTRLLSCWVVCFLFLPLKGSLTSAETFSVFGLHRVPRIFQNTRYIVNTQYSFQTNGECVNYFLPKIGICEF